MINFLLYLYFILIPIKLSFFTDGAPRYIALRITIIFFIITLFLSVIKKVKLSNRYILFNLIYMVISFLYVMVWINSDFNYIDDYFFIKMIISFLFPLLLVFVLYVFSKITQWDNICNAVRFYTLSSISIISIDTLIRFILPAFAYKGGSGSMDDMLAYGTFYAYKFGSIMYVDSNYVGLQALTLIPIAALFFKGKSKKIIILLISFLVVLSLSRSAIISLFFIFLIYMYSNKTYISKIVIFFTVSIVSTIFVFFLFESAYLSNHAIDGSLKTKFEIFDRLYSILLNLDLKTILFGSGFEYGGYVFSYKPGEYAHVMIALLMGEQGLLGLFLYLNLLLFIFKISGNKSVYIILPMLLSGLSLVNPYDYIYAISLFIIYLKFKVECGKYKNISFIS